MALTPLQQRVCRVLADQRKAAGESYVAGGGALNELLRGLRKSRDIDFSHSGGIGISPSQLAASAGPPFVPQHVRGRRGAGPPHSESLRICR